MSEGAPVRSPLDGIAEDELKELLDLGHRRGELTLEQVMEVVHPVDPDIDVITSVRALLASENIRLDESVVLVGEGDGDGPVVGPVVVPVEASVAAAEVDVEVAVLEVATPPEFIDDDDSLNAARGKAAILDRFDPRVLNALRRGAGRPAPTRRSHHRAAGGRDPMRLLGPSAGGGSSDPVRMYLKEIGRVPLLTGPEEVALARRIEGGTAAAQELLSCYPGDDEADKEPELALGPELDAFVAAVRDHFADDALDCLVDQVLDGKAAKAELTQANLRLVVSIAKRYVGRGMLILDLIQEGNLGLMRAVEKFDYTKGFKFSTYATWWIRQAITRAIADQARTIRIPVHMVESINKVHRVQRQMIQELEREPTIEELAEKVDMTPARVREIMRISQDPLSLDSPVGEEDDSNLADFIEDQHAEAPAEMASRKMLNSAVKEALQELNEREQQVVRMRFGLDDGQARTLEEVGREFGVTRERIRQIESKTLAKLRHPQRSQKLRDYLDSE